MAKQKGDKVTREDGDACPRELCGGKLSQRQDGLMECSQCQFTWNREYRLNDPSKEGAPPVVVPSALILSYAEAHHEYMMEVADQLGNERGEPADPEERKKHTWRNLNSTLRQQHYDEAKRILEKFWPDVTHHFRGDATEPVASVSVQAAAELRALLTEIAIPSLKYCEDKFGHDDQARLNLEAGLGMKAQP